MPVQQIDKEQRQARLNEKLQTTNNPIDNAILGVPGRAEMLRESFRADDLQVDKIVPTNEEIEQNMTQQAAQPEQPK